MINHTFNHTLTYMYHFCSILGGNDTISLQQYTKTTFLGVSNVEVGLVANTHNRAGSVP